MQPINWLGQARSSRREMGRFVATVFYMHLR